MENIFKPVAVHAYTNKENPNIKYIAFMDLQYGGNAQVYAVNIDDENAIGLDPASGRALDGELEAKTWGIQQFESKYFRHNKMGSAVSYSDFKPEFADYALRVFCLPNGYFATIGLVPEEDKPNIMLCDLDALYFLLHTNNAIRVGGGHA